MAVMLRVDGRSITAILNSYAGICLGVESCAWETEVNFEFKRLKRFHQPK
jgi:hypothetical protein